MHTYTPRGALAARSLETVLVFLSLLFWPITFILAARRELTDNRRYWSPGDAVAVAIWIATALLGFGCLAVFALEATGEIDSSGWLTASIIFYAILTLISVLLWLADRKYGGNTIRQTNG